MNKTLTGIAAVVAIALAGSPVHAQTAPKPDHITIGLSPTDVSSGPLYAEASGAFARHGIEPDSKVYPLNYAQNAVANGTLDIGFGDLTSVVKLIEEGAPIKIIAPGAVFDADEPVNVLIAAKDRPIHSGADLKGKKSAVPRLRSFGELATRNWVDRTGGDSKTLTFVELPFSEFAKALNDGRIDVAPISEPLTTMYRPLTSYVADSYALVAPHFVYTVFVANTAWIKANPDRAARFSAAMIEGGVWANTHRAETAQILMKAYEVPPDLAATMARAKFPEHFTPDLIQPALDLAVRYDFCKTADAAALLR